MLLEDLRRFRSRVVLLDAPQSDAPLESASLSRGFLPSLAVLVPGRAVRAARADAAREESRVLDPRLVALLDRARDVDLDSGALDSAPDVKSLMEEPADPPRPKWLARVRRIASASSSSFPIMARIVGCRSRCVLASSASKVGSVSLSLRGFLPRFFPVA